MNDYLDKKYRPKNLSAFSGNKKLKPLFMEVARKKPSLVLLCGPSGCGKTTMARLITKRLQFEELAYNISHAGGIDFARYLNDASKTSSINAKGKAYILNEMQGANKACMNALLELLEEPPKNTIIIICTTEPQSLLDAIRTRAFIMQVEALEEKDSLKLLRKISSEEGIEVDDDILSEIHFASEGIPRRMIIILGAISKVKNKGDIRSIIKQYELSNEGSKEAIDLCRSLLNGKDSFKVVMQKLRITKDKPETIRRVICSYMTSVLIKGHLNERAANLNSAFVDCNTSIGLPAIVKTITLFY